MVVSRVAGGCECRHPPCAASCVVAAGAAIARVEASAVGAPGGGSALTRPGESTPRPRVRRRAALRSPRMCGRYVVAFDPQTLVSGFSVVRAPPFPRRWNVAPQSEVPVVHETRDGDRVATPMRWGLVPHWARDPAIGRRLVNARAEGVFEKPSFRQAIRRRRCLLPASGFYEWQATRDGKQPWYVSPRGALPFAMAGMFEAWRASEDDEWQLSCCIVTTAANALMAPIHDRMPVMIAPQDWGRWLARETLEREAIEPMLVGADPATMQAWPVARAVNRASAEGDRLIEPLPASPD